MRMRPSSARACLNTGGGVACTVRRKGVLSNRCESHVMLTPDSGEIWPNVEQPSSCGFMVCGQGGAPRCGQLRASASRADAEARTRASDLCWGCLPHRASEEGERRRPATTHSCLHVPGAETRRMRANRIHTCSQDCKVVETPSVLVWASSMRPWLTAGRKTASARSCLSKLTRRCDPEKHGRGGRAPRSSPSIRCGSCPQQRGQGQPFSLLGWPRASSPSIRPSQVPSSVRASDSQRLDHLFQKCSPSNSVREASLSLLTGSCSSSPHRSRR